MFDNAAFLAFIALTFVVAGFVKGVVGMGLPTVTIGLLSLAMPPAHAASLLIVPALVTNVWQVGLGSSVVKLARRLWPMMAAAVVGTFAGAGLMASDGSGRASIWLGLALIVYTLLGLAAIHFSVPSRVERWLSPAIGLVAGVVSAATGVFTVPGVPYLQALGLERDELVQALGLWFTVSTLALAVVLARAGAFHAAVAEASALALIPALIGMAIGQWVLARISQRVFRLCFFVGLLILGGELAAPALR